MSSLLQLTHDDRVLQTDDLWLDTSMRKKVAIWWAGAALCLLPSEQALMAPQIVRHHALTVLFCASPALDFCHRAGLLSANTLPTLRLAVVAGEEALKSAAATALQQAAPQARLLSVELDFSA